jgi:hypothetical protein
MTDKEVFDIIDKALGRYAESTATLIATELDSVRHEVKGVKEEFRAMNGRLREVCEWKARHEGELAARHTGAVKRIQIAGVIVAFLSVAVFTYFNSRNLSTKVKSDIEEIKRGVLLQNEMTLEDRGFKGIGPARGVKDTI